MWVKKRIVLIFDADVMKGEISNRDQNHLNP